MNKAILILYTHLRTQLLTTELNQKLTKKPAQKTLDVGCLHGGKNTCVKTRELKRGGVGLLKGGMF